MENLASIRSTLSRHIARHSNFFRLVSLARIKNAFPFKGEDKGEGGDS